MQKPDLRESARKALASFDRKDEESTQIVNKIRSLDEYRRSTHVLIYSALSDEVNLKSLLEDEKTFLFPYIEGRSMYFALPPLAKGKYGILEPVEKKEYKYEKALLIAPGVAFSKNNERLGRGKGFYDLYIRKNRKRITAIGVCFSIQLYDALPSDAWDEKMDAVITCCEKE